MLTDKSWVHGLPLHTPVQMPMWGTPSCVAQRLGSEHGAIPWLSVLGEIAAVGQAGLTHSFGM